MRGERQSYELGRHGFANFWLRLYSFWASRWLWCQEGLIRQLSYRMLKTVLKWRLKVQFCEFQSCANENRTTKLWAGPTQFCKFLAPTLFVTLSGLKAWPWAGQGKLKISVDLLRSPWLSKYTFEWVKKRFLEFALNFLVHFQSTKGSLVTLQTVWPDWPAWAGTVFQTNSNSRKLPTLVNLGTVTVL